MALAPEVEVPIEALVSLPLAAMTTDCDGVVQWANTFLSALTGYAVQEIVGRNAETLLPADMASRHRDIPRNVAATGESWMGESVLRRKDGELRGVERTIAPIRDAAGNITRLLWTARDVRRRGELTDILYDCLPAPYQSLDGDGCLTAVNEAWIQALGYSREEAIGRWFGDFLAPDERDSFHERFPHCKEQGSVRDVEFTMVTRDGVQIQTSFDGNVARDGDGRFRQFHCVWRDVTERRRAERVVRSAEENYRRLIEQAGDGIFQVERDGRFAVVNSALCEMLGYTREEMSRLNVLDTYLPGEREAGQRRLREVESGRNIRFERLMLRKDGSAAPVEASARLLDDGRFQAIVRDVTERERAAEEKAKVQARLFQGQKMESIGRLAGGIAHDFNNLLTVINGYAAFLTAELTGPGPHREYAQEIAKAGERAASLTSQLLAFGRKQAVRPRAIDLNGVVADAARMLKRMIGEDIELVVTPAARLGLVMADPAHIQQIVMNLAVNARDAMPDGGRVEIATAEAELDAAAVATHEGAAPGRYVLLIVTDNGPGMAEEVRQKIFEPFFTTKDPAKGTGLGLAIVDGIAHQNGGWIDVESEIGRGSKFKIYLPRMEAGQQPQLGRPAAAATLDGKETVLLVEDQEPVRRLTRRMLALHGYRVLEAADGAEAQSVASRHTARIDLLLTDVVMPGISGWTLAEQLRKARPDLRVMLMSGYSEDMTARRGAPAAGLLFIQKPFGPAELAAKVREALAAPCPREMTGV